MTNEKILNIEGIENYKLKEEDYQTFDGFKITTDKQNILLLISNSQCCCEDWGYMVSADDFNEFIGASLLGINTTSKKLETIKVAVKNIIDNLDCGDIIFITLETSNGPLQFVMYNRHNGYYGHNVIIKSKQLNEETNI